MKRSKYLNQIIILCLISLTNILFAQSTIVTENISIKDGLSSNTVRDIMQDKYGYIWIATIDGVNRYDGYKITIFKNIPNDSTSLPSNITYRLLEDREGSIWISTDEGLAQYNRNKNNFISYKPSQANAELANQTLQLYEDIKNNLWVNTSEGVLNFDRKAKKFIRYDVMLTDNSVMAFVNYGGTIIESSKGGLYVTSQSYGLLKFDYQSELFVQVPLEEKGNELISMHRYYDIEADSLNNLWLAIHTGLLKVDLNENKVYDSTPFKKVEALNVFRDNAVAGLMIDSNNKMWAGTGTNGVYLYDPATQNFRQIITPFSNVSYRKMIEDKSGIIWISSSRGVLKYDPNRKPFITYTLSEETEDTRKAIYSFSKSLINKNKVWLATAKGVYQFDEENSSFKNASSIDKRLLRFDELGVYSVLETNNRNLWLASAKDGLFSYNLKNGLTNNFKQSVYNSNSISNNIIHNLTVDKDENLWVGTHSGLNILKRGSVLFRTIPSFLSRIYDNQLTEKLREFRATLNPTSSIINVGDYADLTKEFIIREDSKTIIYSMGEGLPQWNMVDFGWLEAENGDTIWTGGDYWKSFHAGGNFKNRIKIDVLELKAGRYKLRYKSDDSHSTASYNTFPPQDSSYWGAQIFSVDNGEYLHFKNLVLKSDEMTYLKGEDIKVIFRDSNNEMWVGTDDGLSYIDSNFRITNYSPNPKISNALSNNFVKDINQDINGNIWIATADGLNKFDIIEKKFTVIREKDGLPSSNISAIQIDNDGDLWVSGLKGISKIELNDSGEMQIIVNYDVKDGLQGYEFIQSSSFKNEKGKLYFGGIDGFNSFFPGSSNRTPPFLNIQDIRISNKSISSFGDFANTDLNSVSEISLSHNQNDLSFEFASLHYSRPEKNRLLFKMDGADEEWQVGDRRFTSYINMDPGDYTFNLKGSNGDGVWNENIRKIEIHISPPWYNNWTAYSIYAFVFFGLLFSVRKIEMRRQQKNAQIAESRLMIEAAEAKAEVAETKALIVQAENERKTKELEEARQLQLSMLPNELPQLANLDIAVYMKTATEVGGDYYDFHIGLDGTLTVVVGDATGHGMKAGTMVTTSKSLFNVLAPNPNIVETFQEMTRCFKLMQMDKLSMCMTMLKIAGNKIQMSAAGMPPIFIYKRESQSIEEHLIKGMPLGTFNNFPYTVLEKNISSGDTILLMTDGFPELLNDKNEMFGYKRARNLFEELATESPEDIISKLKSVGSEWVNDKDPDDDVTFVVIKVK